METEINIAKAGNFKKIVMETIGWIGMITVLVGYFLVSNGYVLGDSVVYQLINLFGASCLITNAVFHKSWPLAGLNVIFVLIAVWILFLKI